MIESNCFILFYLLSWLLPRNSFSTWVKQLIILMQILRIDEFGQKCRRHQLFKLQWILNYSNVTSLLHFLREHLYWAMLMVCDLNALTLSSHLHLPLYLLSLETETVCSLVGGSPWNLWFLNLTSNQTPHFYYRLFR
jgi:hypothetical protein